MPAFKLLLSALSLALPLSLSGVAEAAAVFRVPQSLTAVSPAAPGTGGAANPDGSQGGGSTTPEEPTPPADPKFTGAARSDTCWEPVVFPATKLGQKSEVDFLITSDGGEPLTVGNFRFDGMDPQDFRFTPSCPSTLQPGQSCTVKVTFEPTASKTRMGALLYDTNEEGGSTCYSMFVAQGIGYDGAKGFVERIYMTGPNVADGSTVVQVTAEVFDGEFKPQPIDETVFWTANGAVVYQHAVGISTNGTSTVQMLVPAIPGKVKVNAMLRNNKTFSTELEFVARP